MKKDGFYPSLFTLALPIMLQSLIHSLVNMVDTLMVGNLGTVEIAAVGLGNQVFFLLNMILFGISSGAAVFTAQYWGKKDLAGLRRTVAFSLVLVLAVSAIFSLTCFLLPRHVIALYSRDPLVIAAGAAYLRAVSPCFIPFALSLTLTIILRTTERVRLSMSATIISLTLNVLLNYLLIFGFGPIPAMGIVGAAIATVVSRCVEALIILVISRTRRYEIVTGLAPYVRPDPVFAARYMHVAFPVMANELLWGLGITLQSVIFGRTDTNALAAFNITNVVSNLTWVYYIGLANGASVLIGKKIGEGNQGLARDWAFRCVKISVLTAPILAGILIVLKYTIPSFFNITDEALTYMGSFFILLAIAYPFRSFNISMVIGVCRAGGDTRFCIVYDLVFMWLFALPGAAIAAFVCHAAPWVIYLLVVSEEALKVSLGYARLKSGKWLHDVT